MFGEKATDFTADVYHNEKFGKISLKNYSGKYTVMVFYPFDFTFVCPTEIKQFCKQKAEYEKLNAEVIFISTDSVYSHKAWTKQNLEDGGIGEVCWPMVSDTSRKISLSFGMLNENGVSRRGTLILDKDLVIKYQCILDDRIGRSSEDVLRVVSNLKFLDDNKDVSFCAVDYNSTKDNK